MTVARSDIRCELCDLPLWSCPHAHGARPPEGLTAPPAPPVHHSIPRVAYFDSASYRRLDPLTRRRVDPIRCGPTHDLRDRFLCPGCASDLRFVLGGIRVLAFDLDLAITRQTAFVEHGTTRTEDDERESPLPYDSAASHARLRLSEAFRVPSSAPGEIDVVAAAGAILNGFDRALLDPEIADRAARISDAVSHALGVIDRPPDPWYYGPCPTCKIDIYGEREAAHVACPSCGYSATLADHQLASLNAGDARMLTVSELVGAITSAGETVTRDQIAGWIRREGLVRETENRAAWRKGKLVSRTVYVYRLGDVRRLALQAEKGRVA